MRRLRSLGGLRLLLVLGLGVGCEPTNTPKIEVLLGGGVARAFVPVSALARYVELAGEPDRLTVVLASYEVGCDRFENPPVGELFVSLTVQAPPGVGLKPGGLPLARLGGRRLGGGKSRRPCRSSG